MYDIDFVNVSLLLRHEAVNYKFKSALVWNYEKNHAATSYLLLGRIVLIRFSSPFWGKCQYLVTFIIMLSSLTPRSLTHLFKFDLPNNP